MRRGIVAAAVAIGLAVCSAGYYFSTRHAEAKAKTAVAVANNASPFHRSDVRNAVRQFVDELGYHLQNPDPADIERLEEAWRKQRYADLRQAIDETLQEREDDIEQVADELYARFGCDFLTTPKYAHETPWQDQEAMERIERLNRIHYKTGIFRFKIRRENEFVSSSVSPSDIERLETELERLRADQPHADHLDVDHPDATLLDIVASARHHEKCLGNVGNGVFDAYRDAGASGIAGDCDNERGLYHGVGFTPAYLRSVRSCVPVGSDISTPSGRIAIGAKNTDAFFEAVRELSEDELADAAFFVRFYNQNYEEEVPPPEYARWMEACTANRARHGYRLSDATAACLADVVFAKAGRFENFRNGVEHLARGIRARGEAQCRLNAAVEYARQLNDSHTFIDERIRTAAESYRRCMSQGS